MASTCPFCNKLNEKKAYFETNPRCDGHHVKFMAAFGVQHLIGDQNVNMGTGNVGYFDLAFCPSCGKDLRPILNPNGGVNNE